MTVFQQIFCYVGSFGLLTIVSLINGESYSNGNGNSTRSCIPIPNIIPTPNTYNFDQWLSTILSEDKDPVYVPWYGYLAYNPDTLAGIGPFDSNVVNYYTVLGRTMEPARDQEAEIVVQEKRRYLNGTCMNLLLIGFFTLDGRQTGSYFDRILADGSFTIQGNDASIIWSTDQKTYILFFWCAKQNRQTGNCISTYLYIYTRIKPTAMSATQKQVIDNAVNAVLKPYCITISQFTPYPFNDSLPECPEVPWPPCFEDLVLAHDGDDLVL